MAMLACDACKNIGKKYIRVTNRTRRQNRLLLPAAQKATNLAPRGQVTTFRADSVMRGSYPGSRCLFSSGVRVGLVATEHEYADEEESSEGKEDSMVQQ